MRFCSEDVAACAFLHEGVFLCSSLCLSMKFVSFNEMIPPTNMKDLHVTFIHVQSAVSFAPHTNAIQTAYFVFETSNFPNVIADYCMIGYVKTVLTGGGPDLGYCPCLGLIRGW